MRAVFALSAAVAQAKVLFEDVTVGGYVCGRYQTARVFYPEEEGKYPVLSFAHGFNNDGDSAYQCYQEMLNDVTEAGYVTIVLMSSNLPWECKKEWMDQVRSLQWARGDGNDASSSAVSSALSMRMDLTGKTGIYGHSMGGGATYHAAGHLPSVQQQNIGAAVALHPQIKAPIRLYSRSNSHVPIFFGAGSHDRVTYNWDIKRSYRKTTGVSKALVDIRGASHFEPQSFCGGKRRKEKHTQKRHTPYVIAFFDCHLKNDENACSVIYGTANGVSVCNGPVEMKHCETERVPGSNATADAIQV